MNLRIPHFTLTDRLIILVSTGLAAEVLPLMLVTIPSALHWSLSCKSTSSTDQGDMTSQYSTTCTLPYTVTAWLVSPCRPTGWGLSTSSHELVLGDHDDVDPPLL